MSGAKAINYLHSPEQHMLKLEINGDDIVLQYNVEGGKMLFWSKRAPEMVLLHRVTETNFFVMQYGNNLYWINGEDYSAYQLLDNEYEGYDYNELVYHASPVWGTNPIISDDGKGLLFYTSRNQLTNPSSQNGELWLHDLYTGEEKVLFTDTYEFIGWINDYVYLKSNYRIYEINTSNNDIVIVANFSIKESLQYPYLVGQNVSGKLYVRNVLIEDEYYEISPQFYIESIVVGNEQWAIVNSRSESNSQYITVINLQDKRYSQLYGSDVIDLISSQWIDEHQFMVHEYSRGAFIKSYMVDAKQINVWFDMDKK